MAQINGSSSKNKYSFYAIANEVSVGSLSSNTSRVNVKVYIENNGVRVSTAGWTFKLNVDGTNRVNETGQQLKTNDVAMYGGTKKLMEWEGDISHNGDGSKTVSISASISKSSYGQYDPGKCELSGNLTLTTIPRASIPSCGNVTLGNAVTVYTNRKSDSFTHTLRVYINGTLKETFSSIGSSKSWTPAISTYAPYITSGTTGTATIQCDTYSGSTKIGDTKCCTIILTVPSSVKPTAAVSVAEADTTMQSLNWGVYVKDRSKLKININGFGIYGSTIKSYSSRVEGITYTSNSYTSNVLRNEGSNDVRAVVTDSRNSSSTLTISLYDVVDYFKPKINTANAVRCLEDGTENDEGTYLKCSFKGAISPVNNKNTATFKVGYKKKQDSTYIYTTILNSSKTTWVIDKTGTNCLIIGDGQIETTSSYDVAFIAQDAFEPVLINGEIGTGTDIFNFNASGKAMAIGKVSEAGPNEELLEIAWNTKYKGMPLLDYEIVDEW